MRTSRAILALALLVASAAVVSAVDSTVTVKADFDKNSHADIGDSTSTTGVGYNGYSGACTWCTSSRLPIIAPPRIPHVHVPLDREPTSSVSFARLCRDYSFTRG